VDTGKAQRSEGWQGASVGAVSAKMLLVFVLARKRRLDLVTVRAVAERRPPERSAVKERRAATTHHALELGSFGFKKGLTKFEETSQGPDIGGRDPFAAGA
jgi:hypothetical protein